MKIQDIEVVLSSDNNYEKLTVEIFYKGKFIALLNQDTGVENLVIEFPPSNIDEKMILRKIDLAVFEESIKLAQKKINNIQNN